MGKQPRNPDNFSAKSFNEMAESLELHSNNITNILTKTYNKPQSNFQYWATARAELEVEYIALNEIYKSWVKVELPKSYTASLKNLFDSLNQSKEIAAKASQDFATVATSGASTNIKSQLSRQASRDYLVALSAGNKELDNLLIRTQQTMLSENIINSELIKDLSESNFTNARILTKKDGSTTLAGLFDQAADVIDGERYVVVNIKSGGVRHYKPSYYAEMVSRTRFHEAQSRSAIVTAKNYKTSLLQISSHNTDSTICQPYENKIYSIDGKDSRFPVLQNIPPFHPNCLHTMYPVFVEALEQRGELKEWSDFSKDKTEAPPNPKGFIPVDDREAV